jgi:NTP pyrophosphatase (non-canonical NTP hydrolase)
VKTKVAKLTPAEQQYMDTHAAMVFELLERQCIQDTEDWFGDSPVAFSLVHHSLSMCGEAGEYANLIKKIDRGSLDYGDAKVRYELMMEHADMMTYLFNLGGIMGANAYLAYKKKRAQNVERFTKQRIEREMARMPEMMGDQS